MSDSDENNESSTVATLSPNRPPMPNRNNYKLYVSHLASNWVGAGTFQKVLKKEKPVDSIEVSLNMVLLEVCFTGITSVDRDANYFEDKLLYYPAVEIIGIIRKKGDQTDKAFRLGDVVAGFDTGTFGTSTFVLISDKNIYKLPDPCFRYLYSLSPMISSYRIFKELLNQFRYIPGTKVLVNMGSNSIGSAICQDGIKMGYDVFALDYAEATTFEAAFRDKEDNVKVVRVSNITSERYRQRVEALTEDGRFDIIITPAITTKDTLGVYAFLIGLMKQWSSSRLVLLCQQSMINDATQFLLEGDIMLKLACLGISLSWFLIDVPDANYSEIIKLNIARIVKNDIKVFQDPMFGKTLPEAVDKGIYQRLFRGKFVGQKVVELTKLPNKVVRRTSLIS